MKKKVKITFGNERNSEEDNLGSPGIFENSSHSSDTYHLRSNGSTSDEASESPASEVYYNMSSGNSQSMESIVDMPEIWTDDALAKFVLEDLTKISTPSMNVIPQQYCPLNFNCDSNYNFNAAAPVYTAPNNIVPQFQPQVCDRRKFFANGGKLREVIESERCVNNYPDYGINTIALSNQVNFQNDVQVKENLEQNSVDASKPYVNDYPDYGMNNIASSNQINVQKKKNLEQNPVHASEPYVNVYPDYGMNNFALLNQVNVQNGFQKKENLEQNPVDASEPYVKDYLDYGINNIALSNQVNVQNGVQKKENLEQNPVDASEPYVKDYLDYGINNIALSNQVNVQNGVQKKENLEQNPVDASEPYVKDYLDYGINNIALSNQVNVQNGVQKKENLEQNPVDASEPYVKDYLDYGINNIALSNQVNVQNGVQKKENLEQNSVDGSKPHINNYPDYGMNDIPLSNQENIQNDVEKKVAIEQSFIDAKELLNKPCVNLTIIGAESSNNQLDDDFNLPESILEAVDRETNVVKKVDSQLNSTNMVIQPDVVDHIEECLFDLDPEEIDMSIFESLNNQDLIDLPCTNQAIQDTDSPAEVCNSNQIKSEPNDFSSIQPGSDFPIVKLENQDSQIKSEQDFSSIQHGKDFPNVKSEHPGGSSSTSQGIRPKVAGRKRIDLKAGRYIIDNEDEDKEIDIETVTKGDIPLIEANDVNSLLEQFEATQFGEEENKNSTKNEKKSKTIRTRLQKQKMEENLKGQMRRQKLRELNEQKKSKERIEKKKLKKQNEQGVEKLEQRGYSTLGQSSSNSKTSVRKERIDNSESSTKKERSSKSNSFTRKNSSSNSYSSSSRHRNEEIRSSSKKEHPSSNEERHSSKSHSTSNDSKLKHNSIPDKNKEAIQSKLKQPPQMNSKSSCTEKRNKEVPKELIGKIKEANKPRTIKLIDDDIFFKSVFDRDMEKLNRQPKRRQKAKVLSPPAASTHETKAPVASGKPLSGGNSNSNVPIRLSANTVSKSMVSTQSTPLRGSTTPSTTSNTIMSRTANAMAAASRATVSRTASSMSITTSSMLKPATSASMSTSSLLRPVTATSVPTSMLRPAIATSVTSMLRPRIDTSVPSLLRPATAITPPVIRGAMPRPATVMRAMCSSGTSSRPTTLVGGEIPASDLISPKSATTTLVTDYKDMADPNKSVSASTCGPNTRFVGIQTTSKTSHVPITLKPTSTNSVAQNQSTNTSSPKFISIPRSGRPPLLIPIKSKFPYNAVVSQSQNQLRSTSTGCQTITSSDAKKQEIIKKEFLFENKSATVKIEKPEVSVSVKKEPYEMSASSRKNEESSSIKIEPIEMSASVENESTEMSVTVKNETPELSPGSNQANDYAPTSKEIKKKTLKMDDYLKLRGSIPKTNNNHDHKSLKPLTQEWVKKMKLDEPPPPPKGTICLVSSDVSVDACLIDKEQVEKLITAKETIDKNQIGKNSLYNACINEIPNKIKTKEEESRMVLYYHKSIRYLPENRDKPECRSIETQTTCSHIMWSVFDYLYKTPSSSSVQDEVGTENSRFKKRARSSSRDSRTSENSKLRKKGRSSSRDSRTSSARGYSESHHSYRDYEERDDYRDRERGDFRDRERDDFRSRHEREEFRDDAMNRRILFLGGLLDYMTQDFLRKKFKKYGDIKYIKIYHRPPNKMRPDNRIKSQDYAFITFRDSGAVYDALHCYKKDNPHEPVLQMSFGGRREFCREKYSDLDNQPTYFQHEQRNMRPDAKSQNDDSWMRELLEFKRMVKSKNMPATTSSSNRRSRSRTRRSRSSRSSSRSSRSRSRSRRSRSRSCRSRSRSFSSRSRSRRPSSRSPRSRRRSCGSSCSSSCSSRSTSTSSSSCSSSRSPSPSRLSTRICISSGQRQYKCR